MVKGSKGEKRGKEAEMENLIRPDLGEKSTKDTLDAMKKGKLSVQAHVMHLISSIKSRNADVNAFLYVDEQGAIEEARRLNEKRKMLEANPHDAERLGKLGKLFGLCIGVKSNIAVKGLPLTCASATLEGFVAPYDADVIKKIRQEDGIIIGMMNMDEFACGSSGENSFFGPSKNPAAPERIPGGSSSGSTVAVAAGLCDLALGSDTGGSIRNPASHCGVVGVKPSYGRVSRYGLVDLAMTLDQIGPLARDTFGAALLLEVISGNSPSDGRSADEDIGEYSKEVQAHLENPAKSRTIRVGIAPELQALCKDDRIREEVAGAAKKLAEKLGGRFMKVSLPHVNLAVQTYYPLVYVEFFSGTRKFDGRRYGKAIDIAGGDEVKRRITGGREISKTEHHGRHYRTALAVKEKIRQELSKAFEIADVIVSPVTPMLPHRLGEKISVEAMYAYDAFTIPANLAGCCAASVPLAGIDGIPVGIHLMCRPFDEKTLFAAMAAAEGIRSQHRPA